MNLNSDFTEKEGIRRGRTDGVMGRTQGGAETREGAPVACELRNGGGEQ